MASINPITQDPRQGKGITNKPRGRPIRVLIVNSSGLMGTAVASLVSSQPDFEVLKVVKCCAECCRSMSDLAPDLVLCDLDAEDLCGPRSLEQFRNCLPHVPTIVLSNHLHQQRILRVIRFGVQGFLSKDESPAVLFKAIRTVSKGGSFLDAHVQSALLMLAGNSQNKGDAHSQPLTRREEQILRLMGEGLTNEQIGQRICLSTSAVKYHNCSIFRKLGVSKRAEAVRVATQQVLVA